MSIRSIALAGAALFALTAGVGIAQAADPQDEQVRQLDLEQLRQAQASRSMTTEPSTAPETKTPDGQGGPELQGPPSPEEGMTDEEESSTPDQEQPATTPPPPAQPQ